MRRIGYVFSHICHSVCVCLSVGSALTFESLDLKSAFWSACTCSESSDHVPTLRSYGQSQGNRSIVLHIN